VWGRLDLAHIPMRPVRALQSSKGGSFLDPGACPSLLQGEPAQRIEVYTNVFISCERCFNDTSKTLGKKKRVRFAPETRLVDGNIH
jgi:hypothetical protein